MMLSKPFTSNHFHFLTVQSVTSPKFPWCCTVLSNWKWLGFTTTKAKRNPRWIFWLLPSGRNASVRSGLKSACNNGKGKGNVRPRKGQQNPKGGLEIYLSSFLNLGARWGGWSTPRLGRCTPWERSGTHCTGGWVGPKAGEDGCGKSRSHWDSIPGPSNP